jgi:hypothetical protein
MMIMAPKKKPSLADVPEELTPRQELETQEAAKADLRVIPGDPQYEVLWTHWNRHGNPFTFLFGLQGFLAIKDNDIIAFTKDGPPRGPNALYESNSFSKKT